VGVRCGAARLTLTFAIIAGAQVQPAAKKAVPQPGCIGLITVRSLPRPRWSGGAKCSAQRALFGPPAQQSYRHHACEHPHAGPRLGVQYVLFGAGDALYAFTLAR
jgi:hypothetical protein